MYKYMQDNDSIVCIFFFFQAEDGIRYLVRSRGLGDVYKRQEDRRPCDVRVPTEAAVRHSSRVEQFRLHDAAQTLSLIHI